MIRTLTLIALAATALISSSCCFCCTSDSKAPGLKKLPKFRNFPVAPASAPAPEVSYQK